MRFSFSHRIAAGAAICAFLSALYLVHYANAATFTWDGGGGVDTHWNLDTNWDGDLAPTFTSTSNQDDLIFGNVYSSTTITLGNEISTNYLRSMTFTADAPAYTIVEDSSGGVGAFYNRASFPTTYDPNLPGGNFYTNASLNQQKFDCLVLFRMTKASDYGYGAINMNNAIMDGGVEIPNFWLTSDLGLNTTGKNSTSILKVTGPGDLRVDGNLTLTAHLNCDMSIDTDTQITVAGGLGSTGAVTSTLLRKKGSGVIILNGPSPIAGTPLPQGGVYQDFAEGVFIGAADSTLTALTDMGAIRLYNGSALGLPGSASASYTQIRGANFSNGRLELAGGITLGEYIILNGRGGMNSLNPAIVNYSGDNFVDGAMIGTATDAAFYNFGANNAGEKLTVNNDLSITTSGDRGVNFVGAGNGEFTGSIIGTGSNLSVSLGKYDGGMLTLSGAANDRIGHVLVRGGTLKLGAFAGFTFSPTALGTTGTLPSTIQVDSGTTLDASALAGGLNITTTVQGRGTILGTLVASTDGGMKVKPGDLAVADAAYPAAIASLDAGVGSLTVGGLDMSTAIGGIGGNPEFVWDLAALSTGNPGTDWDRLSVGTLALGGASTLNVNFSLLPEALRPTAPTLNAFWTTAHSWKIIDAATNMGNTNFVNYLNSLGTAGQFSTSVGSGADAGDIFLNYAVIPYDVLTWVGGLNGNAWDNNNTANWSNGGAASKFTILDQVNFTDAGNGTVDITEDVTPGYITFNNSSKHYTLTGTGAILGSAALVKNGTGRATLANSGANAFLGPIDVNAGVLQVGVGGIAGNLGPGNITLAASGTLTYNRSDDVTLANTLLGTGNLRQEGAGILTLAGENANFAGTITVTSTTPISGTSLKAGAANALGGATATAVVANGATLDINAFNLGNVQLHAQGAGVGGAGAIVNSSASTQNNALKTIIADGDLTVGGVGRWAMTSGSLSSSAGSFKLTKVGSNTVAIIASTVTNDLGDIDIQDGGLSFENSSTMGDASKTVTIGATGTLAFYNLTNPQNKVLVSNAGSISSTGTNTFSGPMTLDAGTLVNVGSGTLTATGTIAGTGFEKTAGGTFTVTANSDAYANPVTITAGALTIGNGGTTGSLGSAPITNNSTLNFNRNAAYAPANVISGMGGVNFQNRFAVVTLDHDNSYTGDNTLFYGTVILKSEKGLGSDGITPGTTHIRTGVDVVRNGRLVLNPNAGVNLAIDENFTTSGSGGASFNYNGPGIIDNLTGDNVINGTITTRTDGGSSLITVSGGTLTLNGGITNGSSRRAIVFGGSGNGTINGTITDGGTGVIDVEKAGTGTWTITSGNTYTGTTIVHSGTLAYSAFGNSNGSSAIILRTSSALLDLAGLYDSTLYMSPSSTGGTQNLIGVGTISGNVYTQSYTNVISPSGSGSLPINLPGGPMTIAGNLTLAGGGETLQFKLTNDPASPQNDKIVVNGQMDMNLGLTNVSIIPNTSLAAGTYTLVTAASTSNVGSFGLATNNTRYGMTLDNATDPTKLLLIVTGSNADLTWNGGTAGNWDILTNANWLNTGTVDYFYQGDAVTFGENAAATITLNETVFPASITVNSSQNYTISGTGKITGGAGILKQGAGTLIVNTTGENDFLGGITIEGGTYKLGNAAALGSNYDGFVTINGGTLDMNGVLDGYRPNVNVQGSGAGGGGAIVNNSATALSYPLHRITLTGDASFGGSGNWIIDGQSYKIFATPYLHGGGNALTKVGTNTVTIKDIGETSLGAININQGSLAFQGNSTMGGGGTLTIANGAALVLNNSTVAHAKLWATSGSGGTVNNAGGDNNFNGNGTLNSLLTVLAASNTTLTMGGNLSGAGGLTKDQPGTLVLSGTNSYQGDTTITAGVLELSSTGQILDSDIINDAVFQVSGGTHAVGVIFGTGSTIVLPTATLTATSIVQDSLSIGVPPGMAGAAAVPEPSACLLLVVGLVGWAGWRRCQNGR